MFIDLKGCFWNDIEEIGIGFYGNEKEKCLMMLKLYNGITCYW
jgi:hypothetical protein